MKQRTKSNKIGRPCVFDKPMKVFTLRMPIDLIQWCHAIGYERIRAYLYQCKEAFHEKNNQR